MKKLKIKNNSLKRHLVVVTIAFSLAFAFWLSHYDWNGEMRLWRALGDAGYALLFVTLIIGPMNKIWPSTIPLLPWRREFGIWFAVFAVSHGLLIAHGWANWDIATFFGYEFIPQLGRIARLEPGFGLANTLGFVAFLWIAIMALTSSDRAMKWLGASSWKWLHTGSYLVFYLVAIHTSYFLFMHYTESFHKLVPPQNVFIPTFVIMSFTVLALQVASQIKVVKSRKNIKTKSS